MAGKDLNDLLKELAPLEGVASEELEEARRVVSGTDKIELPEQAVSEPEPVSSVPPTPAVAAQPTLMREGDSGDLRNLIIKATIPEKIKFALFGNSTCRALLVRDHNRMIQQFALRNPSLQLREIEEFSHDTNMSEHVLRSISENPAWAKSYTIKYNLVTNPKTPGDVALKWLRYLNQPELKKISRSKSIPQLIAVTAKKRLGEMERH